jgi:hypothetical protein
MSPLFTKLFPLGSLIAIAIDQVMVTSIASIRASIRSISGVAAFCQQHLPGQHHLPTSASNICPGHNICQHHLPTSAAHCTHSQ